MAERVLDIETDGLDASQIWCVGGLCDGVYTAQEGAEGLTDGWGSDDIIYGHNWIGFDDPTLRRLSGYDWPKNQIRDTLVLSRLANPSRDGGHSLDNHGLQLGYQKLGHDDWSHLSDDMLTYMERDVRLGERVRQRVARELEGFSEYSIQLEHEVQWIIAEQIRNGWLLDQEHCFRLLGELKEMKYRLEDKVHGRFRAKYRFVKTITPKVKKDGTTSVVGLKYLGDDCLKLCGGSHSRVDLVEFNLGSRKQIGEYLRDFGWVPKSFTETGQPIVSETELEKVKGIPEAALIAEYLTVQKRIAQIQSWVDSVGEDGRVHGYVNSNGAVTGRMTHSGPNMAQVPASYSFYGHECRAAWIARKGFKIVGCDADALELCMLAHYMNDDAFTKAVAEGNKDEGTDIHTVNQRAAGLDTRDQAKTFIYAFLYGAGDEKIGNIVGGTAADGKRLKAKFLKSWPALADLRERVEQSAARGWLKGIDGRRIYVRSSYAALNTLLQGAGAIVMKVALVNLHKMARGQQLDFYMVGNIHDEIQTEVLEKHAETYGKLAAYAIAKAGSDLGLRCPTKGSYQIGSNWSETH